MAISSLAHRAQCALRKSLNPRGFAIWRIGFGCGAVMATSLSVAQAQAPDFSVVVRVNDAAITQYEIDQRAAFFAILNAPGDLQARAREALIDERLQMQAAKAQGIIVTQEEIALGIEEFAARANLDGPALIDGLDAEGVSYETLRDFVSAGLAWRVVLQNRFGARAQISEAEIDRALALGSGDGGARIRLAELILPIENNNTEDLRAELLQLSENLDGDLAGFAQAARDLSRAPTAAEGGALDWRPLSSLPQGLAALLVTLDVGDITEPVPLGPGVGIFQMLGFEETGYRYPTIASVDYVTLPLAGRADGSAAAEAAAIRAGNDSCNDLYGTNAGRFERVTQPMGQVPADIALELAKLDPNEISTALARDNGQTLLLVMLCAREVELPEGGREELRLALFNQRLDSYANGYLEELRASSVIRDLP